MSFWNSLNPKIKAAALSFAAVVVGVGGAALVGKIGAGTAVGVIVATAIPVIVGYLKSASALENHPPTS